MTQVIPPIAMTRFAELRAALVGTVVTLEDPGYDDARRVWNADADRRPAVVVYCTATADVVTALGFAREHGLEIAVRSGAHSTSGASVLDDGVVIDVSRMNDVAVDADARRATVGAGALQRDLDAATQAHGLAVPTGEISHTGVAGLTLGGGMGWLTRQHGLTIDNLLGAEVVLADGRVVRASAEENPDLFWAIRGGGGNFGVVTSFEFALHEVGPLVHVGMLFYGADQAREALRLARDTIPDLPADVSFQILLMAAPPAPFVPEEYQGTLVYTLFPVGFGTEESHQGVLDDLRGRLTPLFEMVTPMPYTALQQMVDETYAWGLHAYDTTVHLADLSDEAVDVLIEHMPGMAAPMSNVQFYVLNGAYCVPGEDDTAFGGGRTPRLTGFIVAASPDAEGLVADREWARGLRDALVPHAIEAGAYVNGMGSEETGRVRAAYGHKYERLSRIKAVYDPENIFHRNANITPAG